MSSKQHCVCRVGKPICPTPEEQPSSDYADAFGFFAVLPWRSRQMHMCGNTMVFVPKGRQYCRCVLWDVARACVPILHEYYSILGS